MINFIGEYGFALLLGGTIVALVLWWLVGIAREVVSVVRSFWEDKHRPF